MNSLQVEYVFEKNQNHFNLKLYLVNNIVNFISHINLGIRFIQPI